MSFKKAFSIIGLGVGFTLWAFAGDPMWFCAGFFVFLGTGYLLDEIAKMSG